MIVKHALLPCNVARAFALFTEHAGSWWPLERRHTDDASSLIRIEAGGRFFERSSDGTEVELGVVRAFEPARRLLLDWYPGTGREQPTEVEVTFETIEAGSRITITHSPGAARNGAFDLKAVHYARSWDLVLAAMAASRLDAT